MHPLQLHGAFAVSLHCAYTTQLKGVQPQSSYLDPGSAQGADKCFPSTSEPIPPCNRSHHPWSLQIRGQRLRKNLIPPLQKLIYALESHSPCLPLLHSHSFTLNSLFSRQSSEQTRLLFSVSLTKYMSRPEVEKTGGLHPQRSHYWWTLLRRWQQGLLHYIKGTVPYQYRRGACWANIQSCKVPKRVMCQAETQAGALLGSMTGVLSPQPMGQISFTES